MQDVAFIKQSIIGGVLQQGLAVLFETKPEKPIDYLAKWLLNYSEMSKKKETLLQNQQKDQQEFLKFELKQKEIQKKKDEEKKEADLILQKEQAFVQSLHSDKYFLDNLSSNVPNFLSQKMNQTAVYIGVLDYPRKIISESEEDINAHIDMKAPQILQYIGACDSHKFMLEQKVQDLFTNQVFQIPEDQDPFEQCLYVPDVTQQKEIQFFKIPKLGSYMAIPLYLRNYFNENNFDQSLQERLNYLQALETYNSEVQDLKSQYESKKANTELDQEELQVIQQEFESSIQALEKPKQPEFNFQTRKYVVCVDTLGKDTQISAKDREYLINFCRQLKQNWEQIQIQILERDISNQIEYLQKVQPVPEFVPSEEFQESQILEQRYQYYQELIQSATFSDYFNRLFSFRCIKFPQVIQSILFLLGYKKADINIQGTNVLDWKKFQLQIQQKFIQEILQYNYKGAKPQIVPDYCKIQNLQTRTEESELLQNYNLGLFTLYNWFHLTLELRLNDIQMRKVQNQQKKELRIQLIQQFEELQVKKGQQLQSHKEQLSAEDLEQFSEENWETEFYTNNPQVEIPDDFAEEVDNDVEFMEEVEE